MNKRAFKLVILASVMGVVAAIVPVQKTVAQGIGISGPVTSGSKVATDEFILTKPALKKIMQDCFSVELTELAKILIKDDQAAIKYINQDLHSSEEAITNSLYYDVYSAFRRGNVSYAYSHFYADELANLSASIIFTFGDLSLELSSNTLPVLYFKEDLLPDAYDEYGRVIESKIIVSNIHWSDDHRSPTRLSNRATSRPIDVYFQTGRVKNCVDLKLGRYFK